MYIKCGSSNVQTKISESKLKWELNLKQYSKYAMYCVHKGDSKF